VRTLPTPNARIAGIEKTLVPHLRLFLLAQQSSKATISLKEASKISGTATRVARNIVGVLSGGTLGEVP
jgi:hypothetical protein